MGEPEPPQDPRVGTVLEGRYKILDRIAAGGMGTVYRGERVGLGRRVAIKFLHAAFAADKEFLRRFEIEARAMSRLSHPHCVSVIDFGVTDAPFLILDFADGETLRSLLDRGALAPRRAIAIARQVLAGLQHAHAQGIVHRDVKPANIVIDEATGTGEHARLLDFGLAKLHDGNTSQDQSLGSIAVGTPGYMSPEQVRGERVDGRADVYATGLLLYEMITGQRMFVADEAWEVLKMQTERPATRIREARPDVAASPALELAVARALKKPAAERFQSAAEFAAALDATPEWGQRPSAERPVAATTPAREDDSAALDLLAKASTIAMPVMRADTPTPVAVLAGRAPRAEDSSEPSRARGGGVARAVVLVAVMAGAGYGAWWWSTHGAPAAPPAPKRAAWAPPPVAAPVPAPAPVKRAAVVDPPPVDAAPVDAGAPDAAPVDAPAGDATPVDAVPGEAIPVEERAEPVAAAPDEPVTEESIDPTPPPAPPPPPTVKRIEDVTALIKAGRTDDAIAGLYQLRRLHPRNPYVPYLLGNLFFERKWWTDGIAAYKTAIGLNRGYRTRSVLIRNVIRALDSTKTRAKAWSMIRGTIGDAAVPELRRAAASDKSGVVRANAAALLKAMGKRR